MESEMADPKKSAEAVRRIQDIQRTIASHESKISSIEREKSERVRNYDQQISSEKDRIKQCTRQIDELKRQI
jgi:flagellar biosynthesis chaperone FliJ